MMIISLKNKRKSKCIIYFSLSLLVQFPVVYVVDCAIIWNKTRSFSLIIHPHNKIICVLCFLQGVNIPGLGSFTFSQRNLDMGHGRQVLVQRPVFQLAEKFAQTHALNYTKHYVTGKMILHLIRIEKSLKRGQCRC